MNRSDPEPSATNLSKNFALLAWGFLGMLIWLPWMKPMFGVNLAGCALLFAGLSGLASVDCRFELARRWVVGVAVLLLIDLAGPARECLRRGSVQVVLPYAFLLADLALAAVVWLIAGGLIERAAAHGNIPLRDAAAGRRDLFLGYLAVEALVLGPGAYLLFDRIITPSFYQALWVAAILCRLAVMLLWIQLCRRAGRGFEAEPGAI